MQRTTLQSIKSDIYALLGVTTTRAVKRLYPDFDLRKPESWIHIERNIELDAWLAARPLPQPVAAGVASEGDFELQIDLELAFERTHSDAAISGTVSHAIEFEGARSVIVPCRVTADRDAGNDG